MALLITKNVKVIGAIEVSQLYVRLFITMDYEGSNLYVNTETYISKEAFSNGKSNIIKVQGIPDSKIFKYDRNIDGIDILLVAHNKLRNLLSSDEMLTFPETDPSTGEYILNKEGNIVMSQIVSNEKFASKNSIKIVDIE